MERVVTAVIEAILGLRGLTVYVIVGLLSWAEAAFFLGLVTPGELAMAGGGVIASRGQAALGWVAVAAVVGTALGNATGYWLGRRWGEAIIDRLPFQQHLRGPIERTRDHFARRGEWAIVVGRFASFLRIFVPFVAGASGMRFGRFLLFDVPTGVLWATAWVVLGFVLGESWGVLRTLAGPAAFLVLVLLVVALAIRFVAVRLVRRQTAIRRAIERFLALRGVAWARRRFDTQLRWLGRRFDPWVARGLNLTIASVTLLAGLGAIGLVVNQTQAARGLAAIDFPVLAWIGATRTDEAVLLARSMLEAFEPPGMIAPTVLLVLYAGVRRGQRAGARAALGVLGSGFGALLLDRFLLEGVVPRAEFPAVPVAVVTAMLVHATAVAAGRLEWGQVVATAAVGVFAVFVVALASLVAGFAAPSGIALGFALGLTWASAVEIQARLA